MTAALLGLAGALVGLCVRALISAVFVGEMKALWTDYMKRRVRDAADDLPDEIAGDIASEWLEEVATLEDRPIRAFRFTSGLSTAASTIAGGSQDRAEHRSLNRRRTRESLIRGRSAIQVATAAVLVVLPLQFSNASTIAVLFTTTAIVYAARAVAHVRLGYLEHRPTDSRSIALLTVIEGAIATGWIASGIVMILVPSPAPQAAAAVLIFMAILPIAALKVRAVERTGLPRGNHRVASAPVVQRARVFLPKFAGAFPILRWVFEVLEHRDRPGHVSPLVVTVLLWVVVIAVVAAVELIAH
ncbi:MAG TPA: hypothetical protein VF529_03690 [Solirubrobacteraceae bacterium]|jgi:hypothetical protein